MPLGLYWPLRCLIRFGTPLGFIPNPNIAEQYTGAYSVWERLGLPGTDTLFHVTTQISGTLDRNVWMEMFRTALFDESRAFVISGPLMNALGYVLLYGSIALALLMNVLLGISLCLRGTVSGTERGYFALLYGTMLASFAVFNLQYPYVCTANFRYIAAALIVPLAGTGLYVRDGGHGRPGVERAVAVGTFVFVLLMLLLFGVFLWNFEGWQNVKVHSEKHFLNKGVQ